MRRADRLFQIIQILRRTHGPVTAQAMADELETSRRTVYRDVAALIGQRVPIRGEASWGYVLEDGFDLPPLMLTADEIEAAVLGAQWVAAYGDKTLARAASDFSTKLAAVVPEGLRSRVSASASATTSAASAPEFNIGFEIGKLREAIHAEQKVELLYGDEHGRQTVRIVWPVIVGYFESVRLLAAWCELRQAFRHFRLDRIARLNVLSQRIPERSASLRSRWQQDTMQSDSSNAPKLTAE
jgi:predicted DNA-binding transcriptional regulator YafY